MIYLDNATTTKPSNEILKEMGSYYRENWGSCLSPYPFGQKNVPLIHHAFDRIKRCLKAKENDSLYFSSSRALAINAVILSTYYEITKEYGKNHYLSSQIEEAPQIFALSKIEEFNCVTKLLDVDTYGAVTKETLIEGLTPRTALLSLSLVNGILGTLQPLQEISEICKERGVLLHVDLTHALKTEQIDLQKMGVDFATFSAETIGAFANSALLYVKEGLPFTIPIYGAMPSSLGVIDLPYLMALTKAVEKAQENQSHITLECARLREGFENAVLNEMSEAQILFMGHRNATTSVIAFPGVPSEALLFLISQEGLYGTIGGSPFQQIGHLLSSCQQLPSIANSALSFTLNEETTADELQRAALILTNSAKKLRKLSKTIL